MKGVLWCAQHDKPLKYLSADGVTPMCGTGRETPGEFGLSVRRDMIHRGTPVRNLNEYDKSYEDTPASVDAMRDRLADADYKLEKEV